MINKTELVENYLKKFKTLTTLEIQQLIWCTCPQGIIRNLRMKHGYDSISDEWESKTTESEFKGKKFKKTVRYKRYFWNEKTA